MTIEQPDYFDNSAEKQSETIHRNTGDFREARDKKERKTLDNSLAILSEALNELKDSNPSLDTEGFFKQYEIYAKEHNPRQMTILIETLSDAIWEKQYELSAKGVDRFNEMIASDQLHELISILRNNHSQLTEQGIFSVPDEIYSAALEGAADLLIVRFSEHALGSELRGMLTIDTDSGRRHLEWQAGTVESKEAAVNVEDRRRHYRETLLDELEAQKETEKKFEDLDAEVIEENTESNNLQEMADEILSEGDPDEALSSIQGVVLSGTFSAESARVLILNLEEGGYDQANDKWGTEGPSTLLSDDEKQLVENMPDDELADYFANIYLQKMKDENPDLLVLLAALG